MYKNRQEGAKKTGRWLQRKTFKWVPEMKTGGSKKTRRGYN